MKTGSDAVFIKGTADRDILYVVPPPPQQFSRTTSPWVNPHYKNWVLFAFAGVAFVVLLVLVLVEGPKGRQEELTHWPVIQPAGFHSRDQVLSPDSSRLEALIQETTTTTTTEAPTTRKEVLHYLCSIIVNNASVPQMDKTLLHQYSRADPYVVLYVVDGKKHRRVGSTPVDKNTMSPKWNYLFEHEMKLSKEGLINFEVYDFDNLNTDELIGRLFVPLKDLIVDPSLNGKIIKRNYGNGWIWFTVHWREVYQYV